MRVRHSLYLPAFQAQLSGSCSVLRFLAGPAASHSEEEMRAVLCWAKSHLKPFSKLRICPLLWGVLSWQSINAK